MRISARAILLLLVLFLLATNITVVIIYRNHLNSEEQPLQQQIEVPDSQLGRFFDAQLNLNSDQHKKFRSFRQQYNRSANKLLQDMQIIRNGMVGELNQVKPNRDRLDAMANELGEKHKQLKKVTFDYYFNLQSVLDSVQQQKMSVIFQSMLTEEDYVKTRKGKGHQGQGRGSGNGRFNQLDDTVVP